MPLFFYCLSSKLDRLKVFMASVPQMFLVIAFVLPSLVKSKLCVSVNVLNHFKGGEPFVGKRLIIKF